MENTKTKNIVFVTGAFVNNTCWNEWRSYFESKGYIIVAPAWPFKNGTTQQLRDRQPNDTDLAALTLTELIDYYASIVNSYAEKSIVIAHSLGG